MFSFLRFQFNRSLLTNFYVSTMVSYFLFRLMKETIIQWTRWFVSFVKVVSGATVQSEAGLWFSLLFVCTLISIFIYYIVFTLDIYSNDTDNQIWDDIVLFFLILGMYVYFVNQVFTSQPMPHIWPKFIINIFGGYENTFGSIASDEKTAWSIVPWLWTLGPLIFMFFRKVILRLDKTPKQAVCPEIIIKSVTRKASD